jgi:hypothetical protein
MVKLPLNTKIYPQLNIFLLKTISHRYFDKIKQLFSANIKTKKKPIKRRLRFLRKKKIFLILLKDFLIKIQFCIFKKKFFKQIFRHRFQQFIYFFYFNCMLMKYSYRKSKEVRLKLKRRLKRNRKKIFSLKFKFSGKFLKNKKRSFFYRFRYFFKKRFILRFFNTQYIKQKLILFSLNQLKQPLYDPYKKFFNDQKFQLINNIKYIYRNQIILILKKRCKFLIFLIQKKLKIINGFKTNFLFAGDINSSSVFISKNRVLLNLYLFNNYLLKFKFNKFDFKKPMEFYPFYFSLNLYTFNFKKNFLFNFLFLNPYIYMYIYMCLNNYKIRNFFFKIKALQLYKFGFLFNKLLLTFNNKINLKFKNLNYANAFYSNLFKNTLSNFINKFFTIKVLINFNFILRKQTVNANLLYKLITYQLQRRRRITSIIFSIIKKLKLNQNIIGYKFLASGRFTRNERAFFRVWSFGKTPFGNPTTVCDYFAGNFKSRFGLCSMRIWLFRK